MIPGRPYILAVLCILAINVKTFAQQGDFWAFGRNNGINFKTNPPVRVKTAIYETSDCATVCDSAGNLLFYTDANNVYNRQHQVMPNGDSLIGDNGYFLSQSCLILQSLLNKNEYYIFSGREPYYKGDTLQGFYYSIVDMAADNGLGVMTSQKNVCISRGAFIGACPVRHANGRDVWIITKHYPDSFYTFLFTASGISNCVKSFRQHPDLNIDSFDQECKLRISNDHKCLAETYTATYSDSKLAINRSYFNLYDFNNGTGVARGQKLIEVGNDDQGSYKYIMYDAAFSPDDSMIYLSSANDAYGTIFQYERFSANISSTEYQITIKDRFGNDVQDEGRAMQLASNGLIYTGGGTSGFIGSIMHPDKKGSACGFQYYFPQNLLNFPQYCSFGNLFLEYKRVKFSLQPNCNGYVYVQNLSDTSVFKNFRWYFGLDSADGFSIKFQLPKTGEYAVRLRAQTSAGFTGWYTDSIYYIKPPIAHYTYQTQAGCQYIGFHFSQDCSYDTIKPGFNPSFFWLFGDSTTSSEPNPIHIYKIAGSYTVSLVFSNGICTDTFSSIQQITILPAPKPGFSVSDTLGCAPLSVNVTDGSVGSVIKWVYTVRQIHPLSPPAAGDTALSPSFSETFNSPGLYEIHQYLKGTTGCVTEDSVMVEVTPVFLNTDLTDVADVTVDTSKYVEVKWLPYSGALSYNLYRYTDNDTTTSVLLAQTTNLNYQDNSIDASTHSYAYYIQAQDGCGHFTSHGRIGKTIKLSGFENGDLLPQLTWSPYKDWPAGVSRYEILRQDRGGAFKYIGTSNKDTTFTDTALIASDAFGECYRVKAISNDTAFISFSNNFCFSSSPQIFIPNIFTPNGDTLNDRFAPVCMGIKNYSMVILNRWGEKVYSSSSPSEKLGEAEEVGWDGSFKGATSPNGIYVYYIKAEDFNGNTITRKGMVMLQQ